MALLLTSVIGNAIGLPYLQDDRTRNRNLQSDISRQKKQGTQNRQNTQNSRNGAAAKNGITAQPILSDEDSIPDSLLHPVGLCSAPNRLPSATFTKVRSTCSALTT